MTHADGVTDLGQDLGLVTCSLFFVESRPLLLQMIQTPSVLRALIVGCGLQMIQQLAGINTVMYYSATIIMMAGIRNTRTAIWLSALTSAVNFLFTLIGLYLVEKMGRRPLTLLSLVGAIVSLACLGTGFHLENLHSPPVDYAESPDSSCSAYSTCGGCRMDVDCGFCYVDAGEDGIRNASCLPTTTDDWLSSTSGRCLENNLRDKDGDLVWAYDYCPTKYYWLPLLGLVLYLVFFAPGMGPMPWTINAEIYPLWARGAANGVSTFTNWLFNLLCSISFLSLTETVGAHGTFWTYLGFSVVGLFFLILTLPETKGKNLEEIEGIFATPWFSKQGKLHPYTKKESIFNYVHINISNNPGNINLTTNGDNKCENYTSYTDTLRRCGSSEYVIDTRLCTNRQISTEESETESDSSQPEE